MTDRALSAIAMGPGMGAVADIQLAWRCWASDARAHVQDWRHDPLWCKKRVDSDLGLCPYHLEKYRDG